jgi:hypothetical protein
MGCSHQRQSARVTAPAAPTAQVVYPQTQTTVVTQLPEAQAVPEKMPTAPTALPAAAPAPVAKTEPEMQPAGYTVSAPKDESVKRRSFNDTTANPCFAHAENYSWLKGELQFLHAHNVWRLRYASVDEEDKYGGGVTLIEAGRMNNFTSGQMVRVEGEVVDPDAKEVGSSSFRYRVRNIEAINP